MYLKNVRICIGDKEKIGNIQQPSVTGQLYIQVIQINNNTFYMISNAKHKTKFQEFLIALRTINANGKILLSFMK
jgi:hypothetical protein